MRFKESWILEQQKVFCFGFSFNPSGWGSNIRSHVRDISVLLIKWYFYKIVFLFLNLQPSKLLFVSSKSRFSCHFYRSLLNKNALICMLRITLKYYWYRSMKWLALVLMAFWEINCFLFLLSPGRETVSNKYW